MGFSWSSYVAQSTLMAICSLGGLGADRVLAPSIQLLDDLSLTFAVATDDLMVFSDGPDDASILAARAVENVMVEHGVINKSREGC